MSAQPTPLTVAARKRSVPIPSHDRLGVVSIAIAQVGVGQGQRGECRGAIAHEKVGHGSRIVALVHGDGFPVAGRVLVNPQPVQRLR